MSDDNEIIPEGRIIEMKMLFVMPAAATKEQVLEWLDLQLGSGPCDTENNPLGQHELVAHTEPDLRDTGLRNREEQFGPNPDGIRYVRFWMEPDDR